MALAVIGITIGLIGVFPIGRDLYGWVLQRMPTRHLLDLGTRSRLDVVVTTNEIQRQEPGVADAYLTAVGEVRGVAALGGVLSRVYPHKALKVHISEEYAGNPEGDLVLLGGPRRNRWSRHFVNRLNHYYGAGLLFDAEACRIEVGDFQVSDFDLQHVAGVPSRDLGLVILARWDAAASQRVILCGGLTTYGTEAAARFLFIDIHKDPALRRRLTHLVDAAQVVAIGVHALIEARSVQQTSIYRVNGRELIWTSIP